MKKSINWDERKKIEGSEVQWTSVVGAKEWENGKIRTGSESVECYNPRS